MSVICLLFVCYFSLNYLGCGLRKALLVGQISIFSVLVMFFVVFYIGSKEKSIDELFFSSKKKVQNTSPEPLLMCLGYSS